MNGKIQEDTNARTILAVEQRAADLKSALWDAANALRYLKL